MAREDIGGARLDPDPDERELALLLPGARPLELVVTELDAALLERLRRVGLGQRHCHVQVGDARLEAGVEDRDVEDRVDGIQDVRGGRGAYQIGDGALRRCVDVVGAEAGVVQRRDDGFGATGVVVGECAVLEERAPLDDAGEGGADATRPDDEDSHGVVLPDRAVRGDTSVRGETRGSR